MSKIVEYKRETNFQYYFCEFEKLAYICELVASVKDDTTKHNGVADSKEEEVKKRNKKISYDSKRKNQ